VFLLPVYVKRVDSASDRDAPTNAFYQINFSDWQKYAMRRESDVQEDDDGTAKKTLGTVFTDAVSKIPVVGKVVTRKRGREEAGIDATPDADPELYYHYGATAYFDANKKFIGLFWPERAAEKGSKLVRYADDDFETAALVFRSTLMTIVTVQDHLVRVHWIVANSGLVNSEMYLSPNHSIRRLLRPHVYGTAAINSGSTSLLAPVNGLAFRLFGIRQNDWFKMVDGCMRNFKFESLEEHFVAAGLPDSDRTSMPFYQDGLEVWNAIQTYVTNYIEIFYENIDPANDPELKKFWAGYVSYFGSGSTIPGFQQIGALNKPNLI
jgi:hypothetical protein